MHDIELKDEDWKESKATIQRESEEVPSIGVEIFRQQPALRA